MKKIKALVILLIVPLILFSGCTGKSTPSETSILLTDKEAFRITPEVQTNHVEFIKIVGFSVNNTTEQPEKIIISATGGAPVFQTLDKKELGPGENMTITVWEQSSDLTKTITINKIKQVVEEGSRTVAADINIKVQ